MVAATVLVVGTRLGAYADAEGQFTILNVPPGTYEVKVSRLGFDRGDGRGTWSSRRTTPPGWTSSWARRRCRRRGGGGDRRAAAGRPQADQHAGQPHHRGDRGLPVQELEDVVNLQAGVVDGHFRGGREGEVQYQVDGVSVNNAFDNTSTLQRRPLAAAGSAGHQRHLRRRVRPGHERRRQRRAQAGRPRTSRDAEAYAGGFVFPGRRRRAPDRRRVRPTGIQNYQLDAQRTAAGRRAPSSWLSGRRYVFDDYVYGERRFVPTDRADFENQDLHAHRRRRGGAARLLRGSGRAWRSSPTTRCANAKLSYQAIFNHGEGRRTNFAFRFNPDGLSTQQHLRHHPRARLDPHLRRHRRSST